MNTNAETRFMEIWDEKTARRESSGVEDAEDAIRQFLTENAVIPRDQMPELDEDGVAFDEWWKQGYKPEVERLRRDAAYCLARAEWFDAKETRDAEAKLSERRNKVLAELRERAGSLVGVPYEEMRVDTGNRIAVDMILEAEDGAGK